MAPPNRRVLGCSWGAPVASAGASLPVAPASRWLGASKRCPTARRSGCPVLVASERGFSPRPESPPPREPEPFSPSLSPKASFGGLGHPAPVGVRSPVRRIPSRRNNPRSRGIFESPGLSPNFFFNPQKCSRRPPFMHRDVPRSTGVSSGFVDGWTVIRLNGRRWRSSKSPTRSRSLRRARGVPTCSSSRPRAAFLLPVSGHRPKEK